MEQSMDTASPVIAITMGDPVGIGPEIIVKTLDDPNLYRFCSPLVIGDVNVLEAAREIISSCVKIRSVERTDRIRYRPGCIDVIGLSSFKTGAITWGKPTADTGRAMIDYVKAAIELASSEQASAIVTAPINKFAMQLAGSRYSGHTELLAEQTRCNEFAMMLAGKKLRVVLVTIHVPLAQVPSLLSESRILKTIRIAASSLKERFGIHNPRIAVAGLNPHAGEGGLFGNEEQNIIAPAVAQAKAEGNCVYGPYPPDTVFYQAEKGQFDAVVCLYHDQGLIPFKMIHFTDGVNTTLGLPIIRTSVDHGTAYDIAGTGTADNGSLIAAIKMAACQAKNRYGI